MLPIRRRLYQSQPGFSPRQLFASLQGAWLEPTPGYIWQENTGVTPTTTGGQPIGLMLDQSQGAVLGPELVTNGTFDTDTSGWSDLNPSRGTFVSTNGQLVATNNGTNATGPTLIQNIITTQGATYRVTATVISISGAGAEARLRILADGATSLADFTRTSAGAFNYTFIANRTSTVGVWVYPTGLNAVVVMDNISVRQILGNHAAQSVSGSRSTYQLNNGLPLARHDATDSLVVSLPNLGSGAYSASGSVYFATPVGMSALHNQSMGTTFTLPALSTDIYSWIVVPQRLSTTLENRLERYMLRKAGLAAPDYLTDDSGSILTDDIGDPLLAG